MAGSIFDKVGVPFDGSNAAGAAVQAVAPVLEAMDGSVHSIMVFDQYVQNQLSEFAETERLTLRDAARIACERFTKELSDQGIEASHAIVEGADVVAGVASASSAAGCTCLLLATHGHGGVTRWFTGNLRDKIVGSAGVPILVMPPAH